MRKVLKFLDLHLEELFLGVLLSAIAIIMMAQVIVRYIFNGSIIWSMELCCMCFVYIAFLSTGYCIRYKSFAYLDAITRNFPRKIQNILQYLIWAIMLGFLAYLMVASWQCIITLNERYTAILRIPNSFYYVACFLGFGDGIIRIIQQFYFAFKGKNDDDIKAMEKEFESEDAAKLREIMEKGAKE